MINVDIASTKHARQINETAETEEVIKLLDMILSDPKVPEQERHNAEVTLKMLKLKPL